jgi:hypothetical protein
MKQCSTLKEVREVNPMVSNHLLQIVIDYCNSEEINPYHESLGRLLGGDAFFLDTEGEIDAAIQMVGCDTPDLVSRIGSLIQIFFATNNAGGPSFYVPEAVYIGWALKQDDKRKENFRETHFDD